MSNALVHRGALPCALGLAFAISSTGAEPPSESPPHPKPAVRTSATPSRVSGDAVEGAQAPPAASAEVIHPFLPSKHGFAFPNSFQGYPLPCPAPDWLKLPKEIPARFGLCGGMSRAAAERFRRGLSAPSDRLPPAIGGALYRELYDAQLESLGVAGATIAEFGTCMLLPDDGELGLRASTADELKDVTDAIRGGHTVILGLVLASTENGLALWDNHQVLAYGYRICNPSNSPGTTPPSPSPSKRPATKTHEEEHSEAWQVEFNIYDPNEPSKDDVRLRCQVEVRDGVIEKYDEARTWICSQARGTRPIRGVFLIDSLPTPSKEVQR